MITYHVAHRDEPTCRSCASFIEREVKPGKHDCMHLLKGVYVEPECTCAHHSQKQVVEINA